MEIHDHHNVNNAVVLDQQYAQGGSARGRDGGNTSRWNPTKEQINMLENFYRQGIRTPSAEQIQQVTCRLRAYGHIEAKNVFYWFQNHKARLRQKQKQESMISNRARHFPRPPHPIFPHPPPHHHPFPNVMCNPCYIPPVQSEVGFYQQCPYPNKVPLPGGAKRRPRTLKSDKPRTTCASGSDYEPLPHGYTGRGCCSGDKMNCATKKLIGIFTDQETLPLFPLQPTGILQHGREDQNPSSGSITANYADNSTSALIGSNSEIDSDQPFYNFFSG